MSYQRRQEYHDVADTEWDFAMSKPWKQDAITQAARYPFPPETTATWLNYFEGDVYKTVLFLDTVLTNPSLIHSMALAQQIKESDVG